MGLAIEEKDVFSSFLRYSSTHAEISKPESLFQRGIQSIAGQPYSEDLLEGLGGDSQGIWGVVDLLLLQYNLNNRMLRKNISERRFNTAAARIMLSSKLPSDFFQPSREKQARENSLWSHRHEDAEAHVNSPNLKKDALLFTFHRSSSEDRLKHRKPHWPGDPPTPKLLSKASRKSQPKLPPVSLQLPKGHKENINTSWFKDFGCNKDKLKKLGRISNQLLVSHKSIQEQEQPHALR